jgi:hypothetical protein
MEQVLNLLWLLVAVSSALYFRRSLAALPLRRLAFRSAIALGCALAILFPVISLTDDLHAEQAVMEDSKASRKVLKAGAASDRSPEAVKFHHPPAEVLSAIPHYRASVLVGLVASRGLPFLFLSNRKSDLSRAPPLNQD